MMPRRAARMMVELRPTTLPDTFWLESGQNSCGLFAESSPELLTDDHGRTPSQMHGFGRNKRPPHPDPWPVPRRLPPRTPGLLPTLLSASERIWLILGEIGCMPC
jgi:hypothetical protein